MAHNDVYLPTPHDGIAIPRRRGRGFVVAASVAVVVIVAVVAAAAWAGVFAKDDAPPRVALTTPAEGAKYAGVIFLQGTVADASKLASFTLTLDGADRTPALDLAGRRTLKFKFKLDTASMADGKHEVAVAAADARGNKADIRATFYVENHPTTLKLSFEPNRVDQGRILAVKLTSNKKLYNLEGALWDQKFPFFPVADGFESIVGVRASCPPGDYPVVVSGYDAYDKPLKLEGKVTVADGGYITEEIEIVAREKKALFDPALEEKKALEYRKEEAILTRARDEQLWAGKFVVPAPGKYTSPFGTYRTFSTGGEERHLGTDIANKEGTPVRAANRGVVMLAEGLIVRGNAIIVDHGRGVFTIYNHLSALAVKPGDKVEKGQIVGWMGATGLATGPHLHWELRVFKWVVDPLQWTTMVFTYRTPEDEAKAEGDVEKGYEAALAAEPPKPLAATGGELTAGEIIPGLKEEEKE